MKTKNVILIAVFTVFLNLKGNAQEGYENRYFFAYIPAINQENKTAYFSDLIYYTNQYDCGQDYDFEAKVRKAFSNYLSAHYNDIFPYGTQNVWIEAYKENSTSTFLKSTQEAYDRMNTLKSEILGYSEQHEVILTSFSYSCE
jgi:hypothetical protein